MDYVATLCAVIAGDKLRWRILGLVRSLRLPDSWIGAGFVRNAIWDHLHHYPASPPAGDVDVLWFDPRQADPDRDRALEMTLHRMDPSVTWSVKNQARMHLRNDDPPYASATDAMRHWPETATAVAVRRDDHDRCDVAAPLGLADLFGLLVRPTPSFGSAKRTIYDQRLQAKGWLTTWPRLRVEP
jgi:hypothetical protein